MAQQYPPHGIGAADEIKKLLIVFSFENGISFRAYRQYYSLEFVRQPEYLHAHGDRVDSAVLLDTIFDFICDTSLSLIFVESRGQMLSWLDVFRSLIWQREPGRSPRDMHPIKHAELVLRFLHEIYDNCA